jgi:hypothetical protein
MKAIELSVTVNRPMHEAQDQVLGEIDPLCRRRSNSERFRRSKSERLSRG